MLNPDFKDMLSCLQNEEVEFIIVGAYALAAHGLPRSTGGLDVWVRNSRDNASKILRAPIRSAPRFRICLRVTSPRRRRYFKSASRHAALIFSPRSTESTLLTHGRKPLALKWMGWS